jgi:hypothetical protein
VNATSSIVIVAIVIMVMVMMIPAIVVIVIAVRAVMMMMMVMMPPTVMVMVMVIRSSVPDRLACRQWVKNGRDAIFTRRPFSHPERTCWIQFSRMKRFMSEDQRHATHESSTFSRVGPSANSC